MLYFAAGLVLGYLSNYIYHYIATQPFVHELKDVWDDTDPMDEWIEHLLSLHLQQVTEKPTKAVEIEMHTKHNRKPKDTPKKSTSEGWNWVYNLLPAQKIIPVDK